MKSTLAVIAALAAALFGAWWLGDSMANTQWELKYAKDLAVAKQGETDALRNVVDVERFFVGKLEEVRTDARTQIDSAVADAAAATRVSAGLRDDAKRLARTACPTHTEAATPTGGEAEAAPAMVLADVLGRADQAAGELAAAYDQARVAGLACEASWAGVMHEGKPYADQ